MYSISRAKSEADRGVAVKQKFIVLDRDGKFDTRAKKAVGEMKGVIQGVECTGGTIAVLLESGERLDLKVLFTACILVFLS